MRRSMLVLAMVAVLAGLLPGSFGEASAATCGANVPTAEFAPRVAVSPGHAQIWRLYQAFFLRQPDEGGLSYWYGIRARGASMSEIAYVFSVSDEFQARYGNLSDGDFVDLVYANVLCRPPDAGGRAYWVDRLRAGDVTRWDMVVNFVELREYLSRTGTCHSIFPAEDAASAHCPHPDLVPLAQADLVRDGYRARDFTITRVAGGTGTLRGVETDPSRNLLWTSGERCSVASTNGVWIAEAGKDGPTPSINGLGLVDGRHVRGSADRLDRGVVGLRFDNAPQEVTVPRYDGKGTYHQISSIIHRDAPAVIDSWHAVAESVDGVDEPDPDQWVWALSGMPFIIGGQTNAEFDDAYASDPYTHQTRNHAVLLYDAETDVLFFGATATLDTRDLVRWAERQGYDELVKFDGGASTEFNVAGQAVVAGTSRHVPVWFGIGC